MAVTGPYSLTLEVPDITEGVAFYTDAGLVAETDGNRAELGGAGRTTLRLSWSAGHRAERLHHVTLRAEALDDIAGSVSGAGGKVVPTPQGFASDGLWVTDPNGMLIQLVDRPADPAQEPAPPFDTNAPGRLPRIRRSAILPRSSYPPARPLKLGHVLCFSPDVMASVRFVTEGLGMGLADHAQDVIAFTCARKDSDHHVLAFANGPAIGFHHASFQLADPDAVGRAGRDLADKAGRGNWGFGRHTIGSNFFHYVEDPWASWFEYYADMDHIDDHALWQPTNYAMEDSLASWGPAVPPDFVHNYEADAAA